MAFQFRSLSLFATAAYLALALLLATNVNGAIHYKDLDAHVAKYDYLKLSASVDEHFARRQTKINPLTLHAFGKSYTLDLVLNHEFFQYAKSSAEYPDVDRSVFIKGHVRGREDASNVRLTLVEGGSALEGVISVHEDGQSQLFHIQPVVGESAQQRMVIFREQDHHEMTVAGQDKGCDSSSLPTRGSGLQQAAQQLANKLQKRQYSGARVCTVGLVLDKSFVDQFGSANAQQMAIQALSQVDAVFQQTFQVSLPVRAVDTATDANHPSGINSDSVTSGTTDLLGAFSDGLAKNTFSFHSGDVCVAHLLTHRDISGILGRGFISSDQANVEGGVCASYGNTGFSTSLTGQLVRSVPAIAKTMAHELGHNFGASHEENTACAGQPETIMESRTDPTLALMTQHFSQCAVDTINRILNSNQVSCMTPVGSRIHKRM